MRSILVIGLVLCSSSLSHAVEFGFRGQTGYPGREGREGRDGQSRTIDATGASEMVELSGSDGEDASDGYLGSYASGCVQPNGVAYDLWGAPGGNGGQGGNGGRGGDAGDLIVYFDNVSALHNLYVRARAGHGGREGRGAPGGQGCYCSMMSWQTTTCDQNHQNCHTYNHYCTNGQNGAYGFSGLPGRHGKSGELVLIPQREHLIPTHTDETVAVASLIDSNHFLLSENRWSRRTGASSLFGTGSEVAEEYTWFEGRTEKKIRIDWRADHPVADFTDSSLQLKLEDGAVTITGAGDIWLRTDQTLEGDTLVYTVKQAVHASAATELDLQRVTGNGAALVAEVLDKADLSSVVATSVEAVVKIKHIVGYPTRFEGKVPADLVTVQGNLIRIALGKLPIDPKYLQAGKKMELTLTIHRSFNSYEGTIVKQGKFDIGG